MTSPLVSVIVPAYNYGRYLGQTLESLRRQTYSHWECIVVDDGSTDDTPQVVASYAEKDARIKYYRQANQGLAASRNRGIKECGGEYVQFLDSDDLLEERKLELHVEHLERHTETSIVYGSVRYFRTDRPQERRYSMKEDDRAWMPGVAGQGREVLLPLIEACIMVVSAPLIRRATVEMVGGFDARLYSVEDWDYWIRCAEGGARFDYLDADGTLTLVRWHPGSMSTSGQSSQRILNSVSSLRRKIDRTVKDAEALRLNRQLISLDEGYAGIEKVKRGSIVQGMRQILKAGAWSPSMREKLKWFFCAAVAPVAPRERFEEVVSKPVRRALADILRLPSRGDA
ncbi:MAG TPA: glycosyltransferase family A protein [Pyrinomonadaceae bacterium]|jgi:glycosyltransferase involved in cell wall biosynthesis